MKTWKDVNDWANSIVTAPALTALVIGDDSEDVCGLCGETGANKVPHPMYWPGEQRPGSQYVHMGCEREESNRAFKLLTPEQINKTLEAIE